jgi:hypothetical protein
MSMAAVVHMVSESHLFQGSVYHGRIQHRVRRYKLLDLVGIHLVFGGKGIKSAEDVGCAGRRPRREGGRGGFA